MGFVYLVLFLASGDLTPFTRFFVLGVISAVNEGLFKHWIKQRRPVGSCLYFLSFGMPSGHAATSIGLLTYLLLELLVYHPNLLCGLTCQKEGEKDAYSYKLGYGWQKHADDEQVDGTSGAPDVAVDDGGAEPLLNKNQESRSSSTWLYHLYALGYILLLFPVPFSRVYLHDHLRSQVLAGSFIGIGASMVWYLAFIRNCGMRVIQWRKSEWGQWWGLKFGWKEGFF